MNKGYTVRRARVGNVKLLILQPTGAAKPREETPGVLWIHGGGYAVGMASMVYISRALNLVKKYGAVVISPEYRLAGKAPYPAPLEDCYAALLYLKDHAQAIRAFEQQYLYAREHYFAEQ